VDDLAAAARLIRRALGLVDLFMSGMDNSPRAALATAARAELVDLFMWELNKSPSLGARRSRRLGCSGGS
jgi:hypothetical protein